VSLAMLVVLSGVWLALAAAPSILSSGVIQRLGEDVQDAFSLGRAIEEAGFRDVHVTVGSNRDTKGAWRSITVDASPRGRAVRDEAAANDLAGVVLGTYQRIDEIDLVEITFSIETKTGPISRTEDATFSYSPARWRERIAAARR
jgi:hypothetical protein